VLVAGAGPRGVEFARVAAARGHDVAVLERAEEVGGHVRSFSRVPGRAPFHGIADWLATRWPMFGMETIPEVYFIWIQSKLYETGVELITDHFAEQLEPGRATLFNAYRPEAKREADAGWVVMAPGRLSENSLYAELRERGASVELVGDRPPRHVRGGLRGPPRRAQASDAPLAPRLAGNACGVPDAGGFRWPPPRRGRAARRTRTT
jgi:hypothetical protein